MEWRLTFPAQVEELEVAHVPELAEVVEDGADHVEPVEREGERVVEEEDRNEEDHAEQVGGEEDQLEVPVECRSVELRVLRELSDGGEAVGLDDELVVEDEERGCGDCH